MLQPVEGFELDPRGDGEVTAEAGAQRIGIPEVA